MEAGEEYDLHVWCTARILANGGVAVENGEPQIEARLFNEPRKQNDLP